MIIYPALDLMGGRAVRLTQGRFQEAKIYADDPAHALSGFAAAGAQWAHVVDLDGARAKHPVQHELIASLARTSPLKLQVGGGFRTRAHIAAMLDAGVERIVIGSLAVQEPQQVRIWLEEFGPDRIALSLDVRISEAGPIVAVSGWAEASQLSLWEVAAFYPGAKHLVLTDIGRDGMLAGPNFQLLDDATRRLPNLRIQASGGISSLEDVERLQTDGVIIGKALWEGRITINQVLALACA
jgi:phosphoribosylformimino-5-aminoimidazole carboxamide ribotide isomerase